MIVHVKTVILSFLFACLLLYFSMMFKIQDSGTDLEKRSPVKPAAKSLRILTARPIKQWHPVTVAPKRASLIMWEALHISDYFGIVFWTLINSAYLDLTRNWLCQTAAMNGIHERVFIITTDEDTAAKLRSEWPLISVLSLKATVFNSSLTWGQREYTDFLVLRASLIRLFVNNDVRFVLFETDSIWLRNPLEYFLNYTRTADIILPIKYRADSRGRDLTFDPMLVVPNPRSKSLFSELYRRLISPKYHLNGSQYDQDVLDDLCKSGWGGVRCRTFPWEEVADGQWFKLSDHKRLHLPTYIVNNNFYSGVQNKITRQALNDFWFLTMDHKCDNRTLTRFSEWTAKKVSM